jgi:hypothetical protein
MFNATQGVDALLGGLGQGMRDIQAAQARRAREKYEREHGQRWVAEHDYQRVVQLHNALAARFNRLHGEYNQLLSGYKRLYAQVQVRK